MGMTMTQKILARHAGLDHVVPGQLVEAKLVLVLGNDITTPVAITEFDKAGLTQVFDRDKIALVLDHYTPCKDIKAAQLCAKAREFAKRFSITHFYDVGCMGVEHALLPEKGLTAPGECMIGADSHTCTYGAVGMFSTGVGSTDMAAGMATGIAWFRVPAAIKVTLKGKLQPFVSGKDVILHLIGEIGVDGALYQSLEFGGDGVASLSMDDRFTIANMAIEAGAKNGIFPVDDKTRAYLEGRVNRPWEAVEPDPDAEYAREVVIDLDTLQPTALQHPHGGPGGGHAHPAGGHRLLHQRPAGRPAPGRGHPQGPEGPRGGAVHRHPRHPADHPGRHGRGPDPDLHRGRLRRVHPHLRPLPGRPHGGPLRRGAGHLHHQPQFRGPHGPRQLRDHPGQPGGGRRLRRGGLCGGPPEAVRTAGGSGTRPRALILQGGGLPPPHKKGLSS